MSDLAELFARDPRGFAGKDDPDLRRLVERLRIARSQWNLGIKPQKTKATTTTKAPPAGVEVNLEDLFT